MTERDMEDGIHTRCVCSTFARRGKSLTPESSIDMLEDRSALVDRKDETQDPSELFAAIFVESLP